MVLNYQHRFPRGQTHQEALNNIKKKLYGLKLSVFKNLECNIKDQFSEDNTFYSCSGLDLAEKSASLDERL